MGSNPKRTVTVQMVPPLAAVDTQGNKEANANWATEPNLNLSQVCPKSSLTLTDHNQDNLSLTAAPANTVPHAQKASTGGEPVSSAASDIQTPGSENASRLVTGVDQPMPDVSVTGQGVAGEDQRDANANVRLLNLTEEKNIDEAGVSPTVTASNNCRVKGPSAPQEEGAKPPVPSIGTSSAKESSRGDSDNCVSPNNQALNKGCELEHAAVLTPRHHNTQAVSATVKEDAAVPQTSKGTSQSSVSSSAQSQCSLQVLKPCTLETVSPALLPTENKMQDTPKPTTAPPTNSKDAEPRPINNDSGSTLPDKDSPAAKKLQVSLDNHQPVSPFRPEAVQHVPATEGASQTDRCSFEETEQQQRSDCRLYREASTMTASLPSTPAKQCHDMEVQAVAHTCSKAVSTSPSLLPFSSHRQSTGLVPREEVQSLAVVVDSGVGLHQTALPQISLRSLPTRSETLTLEAELCPNQNAGVILHTEAVSQQQDTRLGAKPKEPGSAKCNTQPVYQITIEHTNQREEVDQVNHHQGETVNSQSKTGLHKSVTAVTAETASFQSVSSSETTSACKSQSADRNNAALSQAAVTIKPSPAVPASTATNTTSKSGLSINKSDKSAKEQTRKKQNEQKRKKEGDDQSGKQKSKSVHDVVWDEQGMTWEVYGASVDPESLGFAIQSHLQCKIKEQERKLIARTSIRKSISGVDSPQRCRKNKRRQQNIFRSMLQNVRRPNCCARPPPSSVLE
ncbi:uncharacterized protein gprin3b [Genypterus blacodes]|uniref:uncharacterized protein gprin3b n=1 Tax=Genypterus blacodes TaxID=154954 RepID=UPI003F757963